MTDNSPATGRYTSNGMPHGSTSLTPHVVVTPAEKAIEFYRDVLGARVLDITRFPGSDQVSHAVLDFGTGLLTLNDPMESYGLVAGDPAHGVTFSLALYVPNTDEVTASAAAHGAVIREPEFAELATPGLAVRVPTRHAQPSTEPARATTDLDQPTQVANEDLHEGREDRVLAWHAARPVTISAVSAL